jgi:hypothetical protein
MKVWNLTREINEYDQDGEYYVKTFIEKPTCEMLLSLDVPKYLINHVLNGGGRQEFEDEWFYLREIDIE